MKAFVFMITFFQLWHGAISMEVWLYSRGSNAKFTIDTVQRCYTVKALWNDRAVRASWKKLAKGTSLVFYKHVDCVGPKVKMAMKKSGSFSFEKEKKLYLSVSSFMVQKDSEKPTKGLVEIEVDDPGWIFENTAVNGSTSYSGSIEVD